MDNSQTSKTKDLNYEKQFTKKGEDLQAGLPKIFQ